MKIRHVPHGIPQATGYACKRTVSHTAHSTAHNAPARHWHVHVLHSKTRSICGSKHGVGEWWMDPRAGWWRCAVRVFVPGGRHVITKEKHAI